MNDVVFIVADLMMPTTVSVTDRETAGTAKALMARHHVAALPVVNGERILGLLTAMQLLAAPSYRPVAELMTARGVTPATPELPLAQAYALMVTQQLDVLPVVEHGHLVGQIYATELLRVRGQQNDALTGLPLSPSLRNWAAAALERGHEVGILFLDLDNFGAVNKMLGHVAGDNMLRAAARLLGSLIDVHTDLLCRYGGDEFAIASTRGDAEARALMRRIQDAVVLPFDTGEGIRQVTISAGFAGGRRAEGRKRAHTAATVEDLLTLASRASTAAKEAKRAALFAALGGQAGAAAALAETAAPGRGGAPTPRLRLVGVAVEADRQRGTATVTLVGNTGEGVGRATGRAGGRALLFLVAEATLEAIRRTAGEAHAYVLEGLHELPTAEETLVAVVLTGGSNGAHTFAGAARATDPPHAVVKAILAALNRCLARPAA